MQARLLRVRKFFEARTTRSFEIIIIALAAAVFFITLLSAHIVRPYTSDDTNVQTILQNWEHGEPRNGVMGQDNYFLKLPIYVLQHALQPHNSRLTIFISVLIFNAALFFGLIVLLRYLSQTYKVKTRLQILLMYLPVTWFLGLSVLPILPPWQVSRVTDYMCVNCRNAELGLAFLFLVFFLRRLTNKNWHKTSAAKMWAGAVFVSFAAFLYNDPFFVYMFLLPLLLITFLWWVTDRISWQRWLSFSAYLLGALAVAYLAIAPLVHWIGLHSVNNAPNQLINFSQLGSAVTNTITGQFKQFAADVSGQIVSIHLLPELLNTVLLLACTVAICRNIGGWKRLDLPKATLLIIALISLAAFTFTTNNSTVTDRYLFFGALAEVILLALMLVSVRNKKWQWLVAAALAFGILVNVGANLHAIWKQTRPGVVAANAENFKIIRAVEQAGVAKGYASYWDGNINTYLSSLHEGFLPVVCNGQTLHRFYWSLNTPAFNTKASKSFYLYSSYDDWSSDGPCTAGVLAKSLGIQPARTIKIDSNYTLYIYNTDIGAKFK